MGYMRRHAIVVTGDDYEESKNINAAHAKATEIFPWVSEICPPQVNGERSFFIPPDGSKEGWVKSDEGDKRRDAFVEWLNGFNGCVHWVEVCYAEDEPNTRVTRASDMPNVELTGAKPVGEASGSAQGYALEVDMQIEERGPWTARQQSDDHIKGVFVESDDFTHDVRLYVNGDFASGEQKLAYAKEIAKRLNAWEVHNAKGCYIQEALAIPTDDSVLQERLAQERERCAKVCEELGMIGHWHYTAAIRSMK